MYPIISYYNLYLEAFLASVDEASFLVEASYLVAASYPAAFLQRRYVYHDGPKRKLDKIKTKTHLAFQEGMQGPFQDGGMEELVRERGGKRKRER